MSTQWDDCRAALKARPRRWLVTGAAGFIGSNLVEHLLRLDQRVVGLDNFAAGHQENLDEVRSLVTPEQWSRLKFIRDDIRDVAACERACAGIDVVLHQAALGSVPRSIEAPLDYHATNATGFLNVLNAARLAGVSRLVYASSSAVYGDAPQLPKVEGSTGAPLSPYAATKQMNETCAAAFHRAYGLGAIGLRYFNVFGPRQDPEGAYAAVIPKWIAALLRREPVFINGDGSTSRDFCHVENVVQANLLAATTTDPAAASQVYNIAVGERTALGELFVVLKQLMAARIPEVARVTPTHRDFRAGDIPHSVADIAKARQQLGYEPELNLRAGLDKSLGWYLENVK